MCGICGINAIDKNFLIDQDTVKKMANVIKHRGPDNTGYHHEKEISLSHLRLSIIDLASGHQPIYNEDRSKCIIFNGEIYNYLELRNELIDQGHVFSTNSDTEVILHLYEEKKAECLRYLRGMFAFAIWDKDERLLFIARDRLGIKPLYYSLQPKYFCFSSEIKSLLVDQLVTREIHTDSIEQYLAFNYTIGPNTIFENIKKLMPGHYLTLQDGQLSTFQYWDFNDIQLTDDPFDVCTQKMGQLIEESVRIRLMSEVPLGAFLSGGVDSSLTVGVMSQLVNTPVKTFTVGYEDAEDVNELDFARIVADHFKTDHHEFILKPQKFFDIVSEVVWHMDEPVAEIATIPLLLLSQLAKKHVTVMLSGEGADEIFAGYPIYRYMNYIENYQKLPSSVRNALSPIIKLFLKGKKEGKYIDWLSQPLSKRYIGNGSYFTQRMRDRLLDDGFKETLSTQNINSLVETTYNKVSHRDPIAQMSYLDTTTWLPEDLLIKADKMTMAAAIELRVPFLDHKLVEFAASLPSHMKATRTQSKYILKKYAETILPKEIVYRRKRGFPVPLKQWLKNELQDVAKDILLSTSFRQRGIFNSDYVEQLINSHSSGRIDLSKNIWNLLIFEMWMKTFIDGDRH